MNNNTTHNKANLLAREKVDLEEYIFTLKRHKWSIISLTAFVVMITALIVYSMNPVYRATTTLLIESQQSSIVSIEQMYGFDTRNSEYFATQFEIMKSRDLIEKVIDRLDLVNHPEYSIKEKSKNSTPNFDWKEWIPKDLLKNIPLNIIQDTDEEVVVELTDNQILEERKQDLISKFLSKLVISPILKTQLVKISFEAHDKYLAAKAANMLAEVYIESHLEAKLEMTRKATSWLTDRMDVMKQKLAESESELQNFREKENIIEIEGASTIGSQNLQELSTKYLDAKERLSVARNLFNQVKSLDNKSQDALESIPAVLQNSSVQKRKNTEANAERDLAVLSKRYGPQHPKMKAAKSKLKSARTKLKRQINRVIASIEKKYDIAKKNVKTTKRALAKTKKEVQILNRKDFRLRELKRNVETSRKLYDTFFTRFQETNATTGIQPVNARVMDRAIVPRSQAKPRKTLALVIAFIASIFLGIMRALLKEHLGNTLRSTEDVESKLGIANLGILPLTKTGRLTRLNPLEIFSRSEYVSLAESIRTIRTGLILSGLDDPKKVTLITSSVPNEGKTTLSIGLAMALGQVEKVLLIDADLRHPSLTKAFDLPPNTPGLSTLVAGTEKLDNCIRPFKDSHIDLLPAGLSPPNPLELLSSKRFKTTMDELKKRYDRIIIDSAPTQAVSDSLILSSHAESVIYLVKADSTASHVAISGIKRLLDTNAPLTGVVLNQLDVLKASKFGNYEYYNDGYYGQYGATKPNNEEKIAIS